MENNISKKQQILNIIEQLKKEKNYFSYKDIKILLAKKEIDITPALLRKYISELTKNKLIFDAGRGWYSSISEPFKLNTKHIKPIIRKIKKEFPLLEFSCWSTEQLTSFTHHLMVKFITFIYTDWDYMRNLYGFLKNKGYNVYENPSKAEIEKQFSIVNKTIVIRPAISKQPKAIENCSPIEKILIDFFIENQKLSIMDISEAEDVIKDIINAGRINISSFFSYATHRKIKTLRVVTNSEKI